MAANRISSSPHTGTAIPCLPAKTGQDEPIASRVRNEDTSSSMYIAYNVHSTEAALVLQNRQNRKSGIISFSRNHSAKRALNIEF
jgi:hypothetical protein